MKTACRQSLKVTLIGSLLILSLGYLLGCASSSTRTRLEQDAGRLTYDEALTRWGTPKAVRQGDEVFEAVWRSERVRWWTNQSVLVFGGLFAAMPTRHGEQFVLTFDKETRKMVRWKYDRW
jgi:hypothetical protein